MRGVIDNRIHPYDVVVHVLHRAVLMVLRVAAPRFGAHGQFPQRRDAGALPREGFLAGEVGEGEVAVLEGGVGEVVQLLGVGAEGLVGVVEDLGLVG